MSCDLSGKLEDTARATMTSLYDPDSAQFRNLRNVSKGQEPIICGEVNAKNRLGGYVGYRRFLAVPEVDQVLIDQEISTTDFDHSYEQRLSQAAFDQFYPAACETKQK